MVFLRKLFLLVSLFCLLGCEYRDHYLSELAKKNPEATQPLVIPTLSGADFIILPDLEELGKINAVFDNAKERIWIEIYSWTEKSTLESIFRAKERGVDVRVILEGNVFGSPEINRPVFEKLVGASIPVVYSSNENFTFTHAKFWLVDDAYYISTGNLSYTAFTKNRDIFFSDDEDGILSMLEEVFLHDFDHRSFIGDYASGITLSPTTMRRDIEGLLQSATKNISLYVQNLSDAQVLSILASKARDGVNVVICIADTPEARNRPNIPSSLDIKYVKKPYPHLKLLIIDNDILFIGSTNFTQNALDNNREVGIVYRSQDHIKFIKESIPHSECPL